MVCPCARTVTPIRPAQLQCSAVAHRPAAASCVKVPQIEGGMIRLASLVTYSATRVRYLHALS
jgi:hypothetical protein